MTSPKKAGSTPAFLHLQYDHKEITDILLIPEFFGWQADSTAKLLNKMRHAFIAATSQKNFPQGGRNASGGQGLIVRISGLSAYFTALTPQVQDEIIERTVYSV